MNIFDEPIRRAHDEECERGSWRSQERACRCRDRFTARSAELEERPVRWPWLHGPAPEVAS